MYEKIITAYKNNNLTFRCNLTFKETSEDKQVNIIYKKITKFIEDGLKSGLFVKFQEEIILLGE